MGLKLSPWFIGNFWVYTMMFNLFLVVLVFVLLVLDKKL
jgi:hypothetical protein